MKVGDLSSHGYTLGAFGAYPGDEINGVIGACSGRQHLNLSKSGTKKCPPS